MLEDWLSLIFCQGQIIGLLVIIHYENVKELASLKFLKLNTKMDNKIYKMETRTYEHMTSYVLSQHPAIRMSQPMLQSF